MSEKPDNGRPNMLDILERLQGMLGQQFRDAIVNMSGTARADVHTGVSACGRTTLVRCDVQRASGPLPARPSPRAGLQTTRAGDRSLVRQA